MGPKKKATKPEAVVKPAPADTGFAPCMMSKEDLYKKYPHLEPKKKEKKGAR